MLKNNSMFTTVLAIVMWVNQNRAAQRLQEHVEMIYLFPGIGSKHNSIRSNRRLYFRPTCRGFNKNQSCAEILRCPNGQPWLAARFDVT